MPKRRPKSRPLNELSQEKLIEIIEMLTGQVRSLMEEVAQQAIKIKELERKLRLNSENSGKPPSSDGLSKPPAKRTQSERGKSGRLSGGQKGHPGETLKRNEKPDHQIDHTLETCQNCGLQLEKALAYQIRQVVDLPLKQGSVTTEHRAFSYRCAACRLMQQASFPEGVTAPVQYGRNIEALATYFQHGHFIPQERLATVFKDVFGISIAPATLAAMAARKAASWKPVVDVIRAGIEEAAVKHLDETGFRIGAQTCWLHVASTDRLTVYEAKTKRGAIPQGIKGVIVHDHFKSYYRLGSSVSHALCNAHHLRELRALIEIEKESWAESMRELLRLGCALHKIFRLQEKSVPIEEAGAIARYYDTLIQEGLDFHESLPPLQALAPSRGRKARRIGHNLLIRLRDRKDDVLRFLTDWQIPFTNNQAEQDIRMMKVKQKVSGGFRSQEGAEAFASVRSIFSSARKLGYNIFDILTQPVNEIIQRFCLV